MSKMERITTSCSPSVWPYHCGRIVIKLIRWEPAEGSDIFCFHRKWKVRHIDSVDGETMTISITILCDRTCTFAMMGSSALTDDSSVLEGSISECCTNGIGICSINCSQEPSDILLPIGCQCWIIVVRIDIFSSRSCRHILAAITMCENHQALWSRSIVSSMRFLCWIALC